MRTGATKLRIRFQMVEIKILEPKYVDYSEMAQTFGFGSAQTPDRMLHF
jgi:hypothetical protein